jgi:hypothetical protein
MRAVLRDITEFEVTGEMPPRLEALLRVRAPVPVGLIIRNLVRSGTPHSEAVRIALAVRDRRDDPPRRDVSEYLGDHDRQSDKG